MRAAFGHFLFGCFHVVQKEAGFRFGKQFRNAEREYESYFQLYGNGQVHS